MKLTASERSDRQSIVKDLRATREAMFDSAVIAQTAINGVVGDLNAAVAEYNKQVERAEAFAKRVKDRLTDEFEEKSEKWQESEAGEQASAFVEEWDVELEKADTATMPRLLGDDLIAGSDWADLLMAELPEESE